MSGQLEPIDAVVVGEETAPAVPGRPTPGEDGYERFREACQDPETVEFTVVGRNGNRVTLAFHANQWETGHVEFAAEIDREIEELDLLGQFTPYLRPTGCSYGKVGLAFTWQPMFPVAQR